MDNILTFIEKSFFYQRYGYKLHWTSGSGTVVYPISWNRVNNEIEIQLESYSPQGIMGSAKKLLNQLEETFQMKDLSAYYCKSDGSCPNVLRINLYNQVPKE